MQNMTTFNHDADNVKFDKKKLSIKFSKFCSRILKTLKLKKSTKKNQNSFVPRRYCIRIADPDVPRSTTPSIASKVQSHPQIYCTFDGSDDDASINEYLTDKIKRRDTVSKTLNIPNPIDDISGQTSEERHKLMHRASIKLER